MGNDTKLIEWVVLQTSQFFVSEFPIVEGLRNYGAYHEIYV